jgi:micrococcal nuclease
MPFYRAILTVAFFLLCIPLSKAWADVVISELLWSGSDLSTADEWIELTNTGSGTVSLSGWTLTKLSSGKEVVMLSLPAGTEIGSGKTILIGNYNESRSRLSIEPDIVDASMSLANTKLQIKLYAGSTGAVLMDSVDDGVGKPFAGSNTAPKASMERIDLSGSGMLKTNWRTATTFLNIDDGAPLFGTPGAENGTGPTADTFAPHEATNFFAEVHPNSGSGKIVVTWTPSSSLDLDAQMLTYDQEIAGGTGMILSVTATGTTFTGGFLTGTGIVFTLRSTDTSGNTSSGVTTVSGLLPTIRITEVLANPAGVDDEEWIEIANFGSETIDLAGWVLDEGNSSDNFLIPSFQLAKGEYRSFRKSETGLPLGNKGEELKLFRGENLMHSWTYPETAEDVSYGRDPNDPETFRAFCIPTEGKPNEVIASDPRIIIQSLSGEAGSQLNGKDTAETDGSLEGENKVTVNLNTEVMTGSLAHATCNWNYGDGFTSASCNPPSHTFSNPGTYKITLTYENFCNESIERSVQAVVTSPTPSGPDPTQVTSTGGGGGGGGGGNGGTGRDGGGGRTSCKPTHFSGVMISEILPNPLGKDAEGEWIELVNTLETTVSLCGWELDDGEKGSKPFALDTFSIAGRERLLFLREKTKIALNNSNEVVRLLAPFPPEGSTIRGKTIEEPGKKTRVILQELSYTKSIEGESLALRSDGLYVWTPFLTPSEENKFRGARKQYPDDMIIVSAALPNPDGKDAGNEWIEVTNVSDEIIDLTGWFLDNREDSRPPFPITHLALRAGAVYRFTAQETGIALTNTADQARLLDPDGTLVSLLSWTNAVSARSYRPEKPGERVEVEVLKVVDGDTITVLYEGKKEKVRLIGVDTPETVHPSKPVEYFGKEASAFTKNNLTGKTVTLEFGDERRDKYDRLLAYVIMADSTNFNGELIRRGYAFAYLRFPFQKSSLFAAYEAEAKKAKLGLWADEEVVTYVEDLLLADIAEEAEEDAEESEESDDVMEYELVVIFSEVMSNPPKEGSLHDLGEYIELFNPSDASVSLFGWILDDAPEGSSKPQTLSDEVVIEAQSYFLLCKGEGCDADLKVTLNNDGEELSLTAPDESVKIVMMYPEMKRGEAYVIYNDECHSMKATPGEINVCEEILVEERRGGPMGRPVEAISSTGRASGAPLRSNKKTIKRSPSKDPLSILTTKYRSILPEKESPQKESMHPLLASLLPQITQPETFDASFLQKIHRRSIARTHQKPLLLLLALLVGLSALCCTQTQIKDVL